jgi:hypothetical protein
LKRGKIYFNLWFQRFQSTVSWLHCYGPVVRQNSIAAGMYVGGGCSYQKAERGVGKEAGDKI